MSEQNEIAGYVRKVTYNGEEYDLRDETSREKVDRIEEILEEAVEEIQEAVADAEDAMEQKAAETIESIPEDYTELAGDVSDLKSAIKATVISGKAYGVMADFSDAADGLPMQHTVIDFDPVQTGSGVPSAQNIRPFTGLNGLTIRAAGKNLIDDTKKAMSGKNVMLNGATEINDTTHALTLPAGTYTFIVETQDGTVSNLYVRDAVGNKAVKTTYEVKEATFTLTQPTKCNFYCYKSSYSAVTAITRAMVITGFTDKAYEPYAGNDYAIDWESEAGTVYGGRLDAVTGRLTATYGHIASYSGQTLPGEWMSDRDVYEEGTTPTTGAEVVYLLAAPQEYQLEPVEMATLHGRNIIWAYTGTVTVEYCVESEKALDAVKENAQSKATELFLEQKMANLMDLVTPSATNRRLVQLDKNIITFGIQGDANRTGTTFYNFLISKTPRFLHNRSARWNYNDGYFGDTLTADDFIPFYLPQQRDLIVTLDMSMRIDENVNVSYDSTYGSYFIIATYSADPKSDEDIDPESTHVADHIAFTFVGVDANTVTREPMSNRITVNLSEQLPEINENKNIAVAFCTTLPSLVGRAVLNFELQYNSKRAPYWEQEIESSIAQINANIADAAHDGSTLCFITDMHWTYNKQKSPEIVKKVMDGCNISHFINGGDIIVRYNQGGRAATIAELNDCLSAFRKAGIRMPMISVYGNHDANRDGNTDYETYPILSRDEYFAITNDPDTNRYYGITRLDNVQEDGGETVVDHNDCLMWEDDNYRYAITYWYYANTVDVSWLEELFNTTKPVVIFNHGIYIGTVAEKDAVNDEKWAGDRLQCPWLMKALTPYVSQIRCIIQGHTHRDAMRYMMAYNASDDSWSYTDVPILMLDADTFVSDISTTETITEQSFSVLTISPDAIKVVKVGRGTDWTITAGTPEFTYNYATGEFVQAAYVNYDHTLPGDPNDKTTNPKFQMTQISSNVKAFEFIGT